MKKRILVVGYSQSGQLRDVLRSITGPLEESPNVEVIYADIQPKEEYPFPWPFLRFFDAFPECVHLDPPPIQPVTFDPDAHYDLIILGYQVWFLSPSLPTTGFLKSEAGRRVLAGKPVMTVVACRNMWLNAQEAVKKMIADAGGHHVDHAALVDTGSALATFITTPRWVLTGRRDGFWGLPRAGLTEEQIRSSARFGRAILHALEQGDLREQAPLLQGLAAAKVDARLIPSERIGYRSFFIWGKLLRAIGRQGQWRRKPVLVFYIAFLLTLIVTVVPVTMVIRTLTRPLVRSRLAREQVALEGPSGSDNSRMQEFHHD